MGECQYMKISGHNLHIETKDCRYYILEQKNCWRNWAGHANLRRQRDSQWFRRGPCFSSCSSLVIAHYLQKFSEFGSLTFGYSWCHWSIWSSGFWPFNNISDIFPPTNAESKRGHLWVIDGEEWSWHFEGCIVQKQIIVPAPCASSPHKWKY